MRSRRKDAGFTLAELLVACSLLSIVLGGLYVAFSSSIRLWRVGEANLRTYQDARTTTSIMTRELQSMLPGAAHLLQGSDHDIEFFALVPPMHVDESDEPRIMQIRYRLKPDPDDTGRILLREERLLDGPLPPPPGPDEDAEPARMDLGRKRTFELAAGVIDFEIRYLWVPQPEFNPMLPFGPAGPMTGELLERYEPLELVEFVEADELAEGEGLPKGIGITLTLADASADKGHTTFSTVVAFRGPTATYVPPEEGEGGRAMTRANRGNERGFVLVAVLWSLAILTILTWGFARRALIDRRAAALSVDHVQARFMARGAVERAVAEMRNQAMLDHFARNYDAMVEAGQVPDYGRLTFGNFLWRDHPDLLKGNDVFASAGGDAFEGDTCSFEITDCESRICVSTAPEDLLEELPDLSFRTINAILERRGEGGGEGAKKSARDSRPSRKSGLSKMWMIVRGSGARTCPVCGTCSRYGGTDGST